MLHSGRPSDPVFFQGLDQGRFRIARRGLGKMLLGKELDKVEQLPVGSAAAPLFFLGFVIHSFDIELHEAGKADDRATGPELEAVAGADFNRSLVQERLGHLAGHRPLPDQVIELELVGVRTSSVRRGLADIGRTDGLMGLLGIFRPVLEETRFGKGILFAIKDGYHLPRPVSAWLERTTLSVRI